MKNFYSIILLFLFFLFNNCAPVNPSFSMDVQPIFNSKCALSGCHATALTSSANLDLSSGSSYKSIVNVASTQVPAYKLIRPDDAPHSYLNMKINSDSEIIGSKMPKTGTITQTEIDTIAAWIEQGALDN